MRLFERWHFFLPDCRQRLAASQLAFADDHSGCSAALLSNPALALRGLTRSGSCMLQTLVGTTHGLLQVKTMLIPSFSECGILLLSNHRSSKWQVLYKVCSFAECSHICRCLRKSFLQKTHMTALLGDWLLLFALHLSRPPCSERCVSRRTFNSGCCFTEHPSLVSPHVPRRGCQPSLAVYSTVSTV